MDWLDLLAVEGTLMSLLQHHSSKAFILRCSAFFIVQLSHPYMTTGKTIALTRRTFVGKVMSLLFNMLSRLVIAFLPRSNHPEQGATPSWAINFRVTLAPSASPPISSTSASSTLMYPNHTALSMSHPKTGTPAQATLMPAAGISLRTAWKLQASRTSLQPGTSGVHGQRRGGVSCPGFSIRQPGPQLSPEGHGEVAPAPHTLVSLTVK